MLTIFEGVVEEIGVVAIVVADHHLIGGGKEVLEEVLAGGRREEADLEADLQRDEEVEADLLTDPEVIFVVDKSEYSRRYNNKQQTENVGSVDNPGKHGGSASVKSPHGHNDTKGERMQLDFDKHESRDLASQTCDDERNKAEFVDDAVRPVLQMPKNSIQMLINVLFL
uniref:Uncharacterized protein n=1 Tax=Chenopodium quinoa TaxID=63459 RepID=A0A803N346_CHEQI